MALSTRVRATPSGQYVWEILAHDRALTWGTASSHLEASEAAKAAVQFHYLTNASKRYPPRQRGRGGGRFSKKR
jgi:hypothetical protein